MKQSHKKRRRPSAPPAFTGDHGPDTPAQRAGSHLEAVPEDKNQMGRRVREERLWWMHHKAKPGHRINLRQYQAGKAIRDAWCRKEMLSSGGELREQVDNSPRPDAAVAAQIDAISHFKFIMDAVPSAHRSVVEHVCFDNLPISTHKDGKAMLQVALDLVANKLRY